MAMALVTELMAVDQVGWSGVADACAAVFAQCKETGVDGDRNEVSGQLNEVEDLAATMVEAVLRKHENCAEWRHALEELCGYCERIGNVHQGKIDGSGSGNEFGEEKHSRMFAMNSTKHLQKLAEIVLEHFESKSAQSISQGRDGKAGHVNDPSFHTNSETIETDCFHVGIKLLCPIITSLWHLHPLLGAHLTAAMENAAGTHSGVAGLILERLLRLVTIEAGPCAMYIVTVLRLSCKLKVEIAAPQVDTLRVIVHNVLTSEIQAPRDGKYGCDNLRCGFLTGFISCLPDISERLASSIIAMTSSMTEYASSAGSIAPAVYSSSANHKSNHRKLGTNIATVSRIESEGTSPRWLLLMLSILQAALNTGFWNETLQSAIDCRHFLCDDSNYDNRIISGAFDRLLSLLQAVEGVPIAAASLCLFSCRRKGFKDEASSIAYEEVIVSRRWQIAHVVAASKVIGTPKSFVEKTVHWIRIATSTQDVDSHIESVIENIVILCSSSSEFLDLCLNRIVRLIVYKDRPVLWNTAEMKNVCECFETIISRVISENDKDLKQLAMEKIIKVVERYCQSPRWTVIIEGCIPSLLKSKMFTTAMLTSFKRRILREVLISKPRKMCVIRNLLCATVLILKETVSRPQSSVDFCLHAYCLEHNGLSSLVEEQMLLLLEDHCKTDLYDGRPALVPASATTRMFLSFFLERLRYFNDRMNNRQTAQFPEEKSVDGTVFHVSPFVIVGCEMLLKNGSILWMDDVLCSNLSNEIVAVRNSVATSIFSELLCCNEKGNQMALTSIATILLSYASLEPSRTEFCMTTMTSMAETGRLSHIDINEVCSNRVVEDCMEGWLKMLKGCLVELRNSKDRSRAGRRQQNLQIQDSSTTSAVGVAFIAKLIHCLCRSTSTHEQYVSRALTNLTKTFIDCAYDACVSPMDTYDEKCKTAMITSAIVLLSSSITYLAGNAIISDIASLLLPHEVWSIIGGDALKIVEPGCGQHSWNMCSRAMKDFPATSMAVLLLLLLRRGRESLMDTIHLDASIIDGVFDVLHPTIGSELQVDEGAISKNDGMQIADRTNERSKRYVMDILTSLIAETAPHFLTSDLAASLLRIDMNLSSHFGADLQCPEIVDSILSNHKAVERVLDLAVQLSNSNFLYIVMERLHVAWRKGNHNIQAIQAAVYSVTTLLESEYSSRREKEIENYAGKDDHFQQLVDIFCIGCKLMTILIIFNRQNSVFETFHCIDVFEKFAEWSEKEDAISAFEEISLFEEKDLIDKEQGHENSEFQQPIKGYDKQFNVVRNEKKPIKRKSNPFIKAAMDDDGYSGDEDDEYSDLEDFLVCKPGRDYSKMFIKHKKKKERRESL